MHLDCLCAICREPLPADPGQLVQQPIYKGGELQYIELAHASCAPEWERPRNPDLACYSDRLLCDTLLDVLLAGRTEVSVAFAREVCARQLTSQVLARARQRLATS